MDPKRLLERLQRGSLSNVSFGNLQRLLTACGFELDRIRGSHHIYRHPEVGAKLNLQPIRGQAKPYQIRQFLDLVEQYHLQPQE